MCQVPKKFKQSIRLCNQAEQIPMYQKSADEFYLKLTSVLDKFQATEEDVHCLCEEGCGQRTVKVHGFMDQDVLKFSKHAQSNQFIHRLLQCIFHICNPNCKSCIPVRLHLCSAVQGSNSVSAAPTMVAFEILSWLQFRTHLGIKPHIYLVIFYFQAGLALQVKGFSCDIITGLT